jgi:signal transduction histidine kinase
LVHPEDNVILKPLRGPNEILNFELRLKHKNGYFIPVSIRGSNVMTKGKLKVIGVLRDITERKKVESMMKREVKQLKELEQIRTDLINRISHEFNTPLSSIMSGSDLLLLHYKDEFSDDTVEIIDIINKGGYRLKDMVDNLIIAYRIDSDELKLILKKKNIISIIKDRIDDVMHQAQRRGVFLNVELLPEILVNIDESLISKAILNLLTNAIKNTPLKGNICVKTIDHHNYLDIQIEDTGVGFTKKEKLSLFKKFGKIERYGKGLDIDIEGPGLGLYISNEIVKLHKGEILVNSKGRNKGSKFIIRLYRN